MGFLFGLFWLLLNCYCLRDSFIPILAAADFFLVACFARLCLLIVVILVSSMGCLELIADVGDFTAVVLYLLLMCSCCAGFCFMWLLCCAVLQTDLSG